MSCAAGKYLWKLLLGIPLRVEAFCFWREYHPFWGHHFIFGASFKMLVSQAASVLPWGANAVLNVWCSSLLLPISPPFDLWVFKQDCPFLSQAYTFVSPGRQEGAPHILVQVPSGNILKRNSKVCLCQENLSEQNHMRMTELGVC